MTAEEYVKHYASGQGGHVSVPVDIALRAIEYAKREVKQQMMEKAIETTFNISLPPDLYYKLWIKGCKEGDKLLVIKKDEL